ncbi:MAG: DUF58 domain-containing protein [Alphaproteobacteria bacterium]|nr:DUF58 domain-containing protein [Alphaproteobacteria bacterium]
MKIKHLTDKLFKTDTPNKKGNGLFVTTEELIAQRRYAYQWSLSPERHLTSQQAGDVKSVFKGRGMEFEEIRAYAYGDDVRDIDWRVTARKQLPYTKLYAEEKDREVYVLLDLSPQMLFGTKKELKSVTAAKIAARIGWECLQTKDRFGCLIFDGKEPILLKAQNSQANMMFIFKKIASYSKKILTSTILPESSLTKAVRLMQQAIKHRAIVFVISDFNVFSDDLQKALILLGKKADVSCVNVFDCLELNPPIAGEYMVQQGHKNLVFSSDSTVFQTEYTRYFIEKHQKLKNFCRQFHQHYFEQMTGFCDKI